MPTPTTQLRRTTTTPTTARSTTTMPFTDGVAACESDRESDRDPDCEETRRELWVFYSNERERERERERVCVF